MSDMLTEIKAFCATGEVRAFFAREPWTVGDWTYATDTKIGVRVRAIIPAAPPPSGAKLPPIEKLSGWGRFPLDEAALLFPEVADDPPQDCPECKGTCVFSVRGEHSQNVYEWECENCADGKVDGTGEVVIDGARLKQRYAYLISRLAARYVVIGSGASKYVLFETPSGMQGILSAMTDKK